MTANVFLAANKEPVCVIQGMGICIRHSD